jgi:uncharacterized membrane protein
MVPSRILLMMTALIALTLPGCRSAPRESLATGPEAASARPASTATSTPPPRPPPGVLSVYVWQCDDGSRLTMRNLHQEGAIVLELEDGQRRLERVRTASGARYQDGALSFWPKGSEALLEHGAGTEARCLQLHEESVAADAHARGIRFRGLGNEPGWVLEIATDERVSLDYDYGNLRVTFPPLEPERDAYDGSLRYSGRTESHSIKVTLKDQPCHDDMSGEPFGWSVELEFDGDSKRGCADRY